MELIWSVVSFLAAVVVIVAHLFVIASLGFGTLLLCGRMAEKAVNWINSRRLRIDCSPHESRGWKQ